MAIEIGATEENFADKIDGLTNLAELDFCSLCLKPTGRTKHRFLSTDHIIPEKAAKDHSPIFDEIYESRTDEVTVCPECHGGVDNYSWGKMRAYMGQTDKMAGLRRLFDYIAFYPRVGHFCKEKDEELKNQIKPLLLPIQRLQWVDLYQDAIDSMENFRRQFRDERYEPFISQLQIHKSRWSTPFHFDIQEYHLTFQQKLQR